MESSVSAIRAVSPSLPPQARSDGGRPPLTTPGKDFKPVEPSSHDDTAAYKRAARTPADLAVIPSETGQRLIYIFRDPETGETIRQYPTRSVLELGQNVGQLFDKRV